MTEREKIIEILKHEKDEFIEEEYHGYITRVDFEKLADTLIENGIGDIAEWKARAEVAEKELVLYKKALNLLARKYLEVSGYYPCKIAVLAKEITIPTFLKQAEKEIEEERK